MSDINAQIEHELALANVHYRKLSKCIANIKVLKASMGNLGETAAKATAQVNDMLAALPQKEGNIRRVWGPGDFDYLKANGHQSNIELAKHFNVTPHAISTAFNRIRKKDKAYIRPEIGTPRAERVKAVIIKQPSIGSILPTEDVVSKPNATKWNETNGKLHEVKKGTIIYGPPAGHHELSEWRERMAIKYGGVKVAQAEDDKYLIERE
jgi:hypothetical protein